MVFLYFAFDKTDNHKWPFPLYIIVNIHISKSLFIYDATFKVKVE